MLTTSFSILSMEVDEIKPVIVFTSFVDVSVSSEAVNNSKSCSDSDKSLASSVRSCEYDKEDEDEDEDDDEDEEEEDDDAEPSNENISSLVIDEWTFCTEGTASTTEFAFSADEDIAIGIVLKSSSAIVSSACSSRIGLTSTCMSKLSTRQLSTPVLI
jgi:hypothetical protein